METLTSLLQFITSYPSWARAAMLAGLAITIFTAVFAPRDSQDKRSTQIASSSPQIVRGTAVLIPLLNLAIKLDADHPYENSLVRIWIFYPPNPNIVLTDENRMEIGKFREAQIPLGEETDTEVGSLGTFGFTIDKPQFIAGVLSSARIKVVKKKA